MHINKKQIHKKLIDSVEESLMATKTAYQESKSHAQDSELRSESKWDTRGIEAGYLASAQEKRVKELEIELALIKSLPLRDFDIDDEIAVGAVVKLEDQEKFYFISPVSGGTTFRINRHEVQVISIKSPLAQAMIGMLEGDDFKFDSPLGSVLHTVEKIY